MPAHDLLMFAAACLVMVLTPGPNMIYLISRSICQGRKAGVTSLLGVVAGFFVHMLALTIDPARATYLGRFCAPAVNEPGFEVQAELFLLHIDAVVAPAAEIEEVQWIDPCGDGGLTLAPLTRDVILPFYRQIIPA